MAKADIEVALTEELKQVFADVREDLEAAKEALSEARIRALAREEFASLVDQMLTKFRSHGDVL